MLGQLARDERVVPLAFHVDYFDRPWKDPYSDPLFSRREAQYSVLYDKTHRIGKPEYLYFTPMVMVDGRDPLLGSAKDATTKARTAIARSLREPAEVALGVALADGADDRSKAVTVRVQARAARASGRETLIGVALYEDDLRTAVESGELAGKTYVGRYVVRKLEVRPVTPERGRDALVKLTLALPADARPERCGVAVFAQDEATGRIGQAATRPWAPPPAVGAGPVAAERPAGR